MGQVQSLIYGAEEVTDSQSFAALPPAQIINSTGLPVPGLLRPPGAAAPPKELSFSRKRVPFTIDTHSLQATQLSDTLTMSFLYMSGSSLSVVATIEGGSPVECTLGPSASTGYAAGQICLPCARTASARVVPVSLRVSNGADILELGVSIDGKSVSVNSMRLKMKNDSEPLDLLHLYGTTSPGVSSSSGTSENNHQMCAICLSVPSAVGFLPCRHVCVCSECAQVTLQSSMNQCPICRQSVHGLLRLNKS